MDKPTLEEFIITDFGGDKCITEEGLDWVWPIDDREPIDTGGKGLFLPPTCTEHQRPCYERFSEEYCMKAAFDGPDIPNVPLPPSALMLGVACIATIVWKKYNA